MSTTTAYEWRGGWLIVNVDQLLPGGADDIGRIYGLNGLEAPIELTYLVGGGPTILTTIQQWESLGGQMLMPRADDELTLNNFCDAQGIPRPTIFSSLVPLPAIYGGGGGGGDATSIQGVPVAATPPNLGEGLVFTGGQWEPSPAPSNVLWAWNTADTTQFLAPVDLGLGPNIAGISIGTTPGGPNGLLLRVANTGLDAGAVVFPIDVVLPRRYLIEVEFWAMNFTDVTNAGANALGIVAFAGSTFADLFAWLTLNNTTAAPEDQYLGEFGVSSGTPFGPAFVMQSQPYMGYNRGVPPLANSCGARLSIQVETERPCSADPQIAMLVQTGGIADPTSQQSVSSYGNTAGVAPGTYPASWDGLTVDSSGIVAGTLGPSTGWSVDILSMRILRHPADAV